MGSKVGCVCLYGCVLVLILGVWLVTGVFWFLWVGVGVYLGGGYLGVR